MLMHDPQHPGELIREACLEPLGLTVTEAAKGLGITRKTLSALLNGRANVTPVMAIRLAKAFGGSPESWLSHQLQYDLWHAQQKAAGLKVKDFRHAAGMPKATVGYQLSAARFQLKQATTQRHKSAKRISEAPLRLYALALLLWPTASLLIADSSSPIALSAKTP